MSIAKEKKPFVIRPGHVDDMLGITELYNDYVTNTIVTFDVEPQTVESRMVWFNNFKATGPHRLVVAEEDGLIVGYASSSLLRPRVAYHTSVESAIYVRRDHTGWGVGRALYTELFSILEQENVHRIYAALAVPNPESVRIHKAFGFKHVGTFHEVGYKFDCYVDVDWYEKGMG